MVVNSVFFTKLRDHHQILLPILTRRDNLGNLVTFVQLKKREKHPWRGATFSKVADF